jgi:homoserine kinase
MISTRSAGVRVPCSTSNLGSGFDTLGLALDRYLEADFTPGDDGLHIIRTGTLSRLGEDSGDDLLLWSFSAVMTGAGAELDGELRMHSEIPVARGLGSSAAALVAGHELARAVLDFEPAPIDAFRAAALREGHGDNAAPCAFGGLQAVVPGPSGPRAVPLELSSRIGFAYAAPSAGVSTADARAVLPRHVGHDVATAGLGRLTALLRGLATCDPDLIRTGFEDELHVPHRLPLIPGAGDAMNAAYEAGAWAVTISGSGSGLIAACAPEVADQVAKTMHMVFLAGVEDPECVGFSLKPDLEGVRRS